MVFSYLAAKQWRLGFVLIIGLSSIAYISPVGAHSLTAFGETKLQNFEKAAEVSFRISQSIQNSRNRLQAVKNILAAHRSNLDGRNQKVSQSEKALIAAEKDIEIELSIFQNDLQILQSDKILLEIAVAEGSSPLITNLRSKVDLGTQSVNQSMESIDIAKRKKEIAKKQLNLDRLLRENAIQQVKLAEYNVAIELKLGDG